MNSFWLTRLYLMSTSHEECCSLSVACLYLLKHHCAGADDPIESNVNRYFSHCRNKSHSKRWVHLVECERCAAEQLVPTSRGPWHVGSWHPPCGLLVTDETLHNVLYCRAAPRPATPRYHFNDVTQDAFDNRTRVWRSDRSEQYEWQISGRVKRIFGQSGWSSGSQHVTECSPGQPRARQLLLLST